MFSFAYPEYLLLLLLIPAFVCLYVWARYRRKRNLKKFGKPGIIKHLMPDVSPYKPPLKFTLRMLALAALIIGLARPWGGLRNEKSEKEGIEVIIAVDASNSMLASVSSEPDGMQRMRAAKMMLERLINRLDNDRVGLIVFAGNAYTLIPVTGDYISAKMFLNSIDPSQIDNQGTNIAAAINLAINSFSDKKGVGKSLILITDAEELDDEKGVYDAVKACSKNNIQLNVVGVGSSTPVPIPIGGGRYLPDPETGSPVQTALNEDLASKIASQSKGIYVNASNKEALNELMKQIDTVKKTALETSFTAIHDELYAVFIWIALILMIIDMIVSDKKIAWLDRFTFFTKEGKK